ncbi:hypothetical protein KFE25_012882 [Diacronema lutheri]|uniref:Tyrosine specific protein phosphatases domain-containing protein n=1 Tax=Diacronema lutheri TaxID=2081491 RepID=A0A8J5X655_DIALT|nr:hypothetical protein KFE25_012882 [Diacronema lutheri]
MAMRQLPTADFFAPSQRDLVEAVAFIDRHARAGTGVYVHCNGGRGRSAVAVICYLIYARGETADSAFALVRAARRIANLRALCGLRTQWRAVVPAADEGPAGAGAAGVAQPGVAAAPAVPAGACVGSLAPVVERQRARSPLPRSPPHLGGCTPPAGASEEPMPTAGASTGSRGRMHGGGTLEAVQRAVPPVAMAMAAA